MGEQVASRTYNLKLIRGDGAQIPAVLERWDRTGPARSPRLALRYDSKVIDRSGRSLFETLKEIRRELESEGLLLQCNGASRNVVVSGMLADAGSGESAYRFRRGQRPGPEGPEVVSIFDCDDETEPVSVEEQQRFLKEWFASLPRPLVPATVPGELQHLAEVVRRAFPGGIDDRSYTPLIMALFDPIRIRGVAEVIALSGGFDYWQVLADMRSAISDPPPPAEVERVRQRLKECGLSEAAAL